MVHIKFYWSNSVLTTTSFKIDISLLISINFILFYFIIIIIIIILNLRVNYIISKRECKKKKDSLT